MVPNMGKEGVFIHQMCNKQIQLWSSNLPTKPHHQQQFDNHRRWTAGIKTEQTKSSLLPQRYPRVLRKTTELTNPDLGSLDTGNKQIDSREAPLGR
jgi:hypothetical protein